MQFEARKWASNGQMSFDSLKRASEAIPGGVHLGLFGSLNSNFEFKLLVVMNLAILRLGKQDLYSMESIAS